jgi:hypothetical protein
MRRHPRQLGRIGRLVLRFSPSKFKTVRIRGSKNVLADCLSRTFDVSVPLTDQLAMQLLQTFPASFETLKDHQKNCSFCHDLYQRIKVGDSPCQEQQLHRGSAVFSSQSAKRLGVLVPEALRPMTQLFSRPCLGGPLRVYDNIKIGKDYY